MEYFHHFKLSLWARFDLVNVQIGKFLYHANLEQMKLCFLPDFNNPLSDIERRKERDIQNTEGCAPLPIQD